MTHLVDVRINYEAMYAWAKSIGILGADRGYIVHSLICAAYGSYRMQPFRVYDDPRSGQLRVMGYCSVSAEELADQRMAVAEPLVCKAITSEASKDMPQSWKSGMFLTFNLLVSPVVTISRTRKEVDAFLRSPDGADREQVYIDWLRKRLDGKANIQAAHMKSFSFAKVARRNHTEISERRTIGRKFTIPVADFEGTISVADGEAFSSIFEKAIGKHGAFGFGCMLLRPSK